MTSEDRQRFILANTQVASPPLVPELRLHLADEATKLWEATEASLAQAGLDPPYWAFCWPGGQALTRYILDHPELVAGRSVLDFGAGSGMVAIAASLSGASPAVAADTDAFSGAAMRMNAALNGARIEVTTEDVVGGPRSHDVVLAGDVCYERPMAERVIAWLRRLAAEGVEVIVGDPGRTYLPREGLTPLAHYVVPTSLDLEDRTERETTLFRLHGG